MKSMTMKSLIITTGMLLVVGTSFAADKHSAAWQKNHPRRDEVLDRDKHEENVNNKDAVEGKVSDEQAQKLDQRDENVKDAEERKAAEQNGHITKAQQEKFNERENKIRQTRKHDIKKDAAHPTDTTAPTVAPTQTPTP
jgi:TolA-binding protein